MDRAIERGGAVATSFREALQCPPNSGSGMLTTVRLHASDVLCGLPPVFRRTVPFRVEIEWRPQTVSWEHGGWFTSSTPREGTGTISIEGTVRITHLGLMACTAVNRAVGRAVAEITRGQLAAVVQRPVGTLQQEAARRVPRFGGVDRLAVGLWDSCVLDRAGRAACWGQVNEGDVALRLDEAIGLPDAADVAVGNGLACAAHRSGQVTCWGRNLYGGLGSAAQTTGAAPDAATVPGVADARQVAVGVGHACARRADGTVLCWGSNRAGQLGDGTQRSRPTPAPVLGLGEVQEIGAADEHTCARRADGAVVCWGLFHTAPESASTQPVVVGRDAEASQLAVGYDRVCVRTRDGRAVCWRFALPPGNVIELPPGAPVPTDLAQVAAGEGFACGRRQSGAVVCWGDFEQVLGSSAATQGAARDAPPRAVPELDDAVSIAAQAVHVCAVRRSGQVVCWGQNGTRQLGNDRAGEQSATPVEAIILVPLRR